jgi:glycosyltransferase involved in cell wall biosynthesis
VHIAINHSELSLTETEAISIAFVVNGAYDSPMGQRAREMATRISGFDIRIVYRTSRKIVSIIRMLGFLMRVRPNVTYVFDLSYSGLIAARLYKLFARNCLIVETGDAISELARSAGSRGALGLWLTQIVEQSSYRVADRVVVRGSFHKDLLAKEGIDATVIQDGVDPEKFTALDVGFLRKEYGLDGVLTVGLVGSSIWSEKLQMCYGWELVETLRLLKDKPVKGVMIGQGTGIPHLKGLCREYEIEDKLVFLGYVPFEELPRHLGLIDICLSTQTNDVVGQVRTTGKLPLYLAANRYILASDVGEASRVLNSEMLVRYDGVKDDSYPQRLRESIQHILDHREKLDTAQTGIGLARQYFDYRILADRMKALIEEATKPIAESKRSAKQESVAFTSSTQPLEP